MSKRGNNEGSIFQRKDGRWVGQITVGYKDGKRQFKTIYGKTRKAVAEELKKLLADQQQGLPLNAFHQ